jgi:hypothetical protein
MKNLRFAIVEKSQFELSQGEDRLVYYDPGSPEFRHMFCASCGVETFASIGKKNGAEYMAINVNCLQCVESADMPEVSFDCTQGLSSKNY